MEDLLSRAGLWALDRAPSFFRIALILGAALLVSRLAARFVTRLERFAEDDDPHAISEAEKRAKTLGLIARQALTVVVWAIATMILLAEIGLDLKPILAGAGVVGLAVGFGAQTLVKDVITGFFVLLENQYRVNDVISAAGVSGLVEAINLRTTVLRDVEGRVHVIPNGSIDVVTNFTRHWSRAVVDVGVAYKEDLDECIAVLQEVGAELERDEVFGPKLLGAVETPGVEALGDSAVVLRVMVATKPQERWNVVRELRRRVKRTFDERGIEIPFPQRMLHVVANANGAAAIDAPAARSPASDPATGRQNVGSVS